MKKIILLYFLFISAAYSQSVNEKLIVKFSEYENEDPYNFKYNPSTGTYVYGPYDTLNKTASIISNKGKSETYAFVNIYSVIFDKDGNYYASAGNNITDTTFTYFFLKNGSRVPGTSFDQINDGWAERNGVVYFAAKENGMSYFVEYDISSGKLSKSKPYDGVYLIYYKEIPVEGEPAGEVGFTKDGKPYYAAESNNEKFIVIGNREQKHYSDIDIYYTVNDNNGDITYFAKSSGKFYETKGNAFVVQGEKEYNKFDYVYGPIIFNKSNEPVYIAADSVSESEYPARVMAGNSPGKIYNGGIYDIKFTPSGRLAYIASVTNKGKTRSMTVIDGKEGKKYNSVNSITFGSTDEPIFAATNDGKKYFLAAGKTEYEDEYDAIFNPMRLKNGKLFYIGADYGNYEKKIRDKYFVHIGDETFGPYDGMQVQDYRTGDYVLQDHSGKYAYVTTRTKSFDPYASSQTLYTDKGNSDEFDYFQNVNLYNGKPIYAASKLADREGYFYSNKIYYGDKQIGTDYDAIIDYNFNEEGKVTFVGYKNKSFYWVEIRL